MSHLDEDFQQGMSEMHSSLPVIADSGFTRDWDVFTEEIVRKVVPEQYEFAQSLGIIELGFRSRECALPLMPSIETGARVREHAFEHQLLCEYSRLWVYGAYELVRVIDKRLNNDSGTHPPYPETKELKRRFERVRMPLAKLERASRASEPGDTGVALPQRSRSGECEWLLGDESITRRQLADAFSQFRPDLTTYRSEGDSSC